MDAWVEDVRAGGDGAGVFPVAAERTAENADALESRVRFLREHLAPR